MITIPDEEFEKVARIKGAIAHMIADTCRSHSGMWLVQEESIYHMLVLIRRLYRYGRKELEKDLREYCEREPDVLITASRYGITCTADRNKEMKLEVEITPPGKRWKP